MVGLPWNRRQLAFYGPPGTGKTYLAVKLATRLAGRENRDHVQLVQFHPCYSYEDFFEGFCPHESESGHPFFHIEAGPLLRIASEALSHPNQPYFLIIDEMNRANLAKVFGELYFLLECRDRAVQLQCQRDE